MRMELPLPDPAPWQNLPHLRPVLSKAAPAIACHFHHRRGEKSRGPGFGSLSPVPLSGWLWSLSLLTLARSSDVGVLSGV